MYVWAVRRRNEGVAPPSYLEVTKPPSYSACQPHFRGRCSVLNIFTRNFFAFLTLIFQDQEVNRLLVEKYVNKLNCNEKYPILGTEAAQYNRQERQDSVTSFTETEPPAYSDLYTRDNSQLDRLVVSYIHYY